MNEKPNAALLPSPMALAYLGDARHSLFIRKMLVASGVSKSGELNRLSLEYVTAEAQARAFSRIEDELTEDERDLYMRARNSTHINRPKHASGRDYRVATGFEAIIGMHSYLGNEERIEYLLTKATQINGGQTND